MSRKNLNLAHRRPFKAKGMHREGGGNSCVRQADVCMALTKTLNKPKLTPEQLRLVTGDSSVTERASQ